MPARPQLPQTRQHMAQATKVSQEFDHGFGCWWLVGNKSSSDVAEYADMRFATPQDSA